MKFLFAAGLFDSPWVVLAILVGSAVANWLAKRRQEKQADQQDPQPPGEESMPPARPSASEFDLEETLRRLMGEESRPAPRTPPVIPQTPRPDRSPTRSWAEELLVPQVPPPRPASPTLPASPPPPILPPAIITRLEPAGEVDLSEERFEQLTAQVKKPATVVTHRLGFPAARRGRRGAVLWRDARSARRAFVAALVFAPPKSMEP